MSSSQVESNAPQLPRRAIPGSYGIPLISPIKDRIEFFGNPDKFFQSRVDRYGSTVIRVNSPPGPFLAGNPRAIALLDAKSYPVLFDPSKVEKKDVLTGSYMAPTSLTGGFRVCAYRDPSEPDHAKIKQLLLSLLLSRKDHAIPEFRSSYAKLFADMEDGVAQSGKFVFNDRNEEATLEFIGRFFFGVNPRETELGGDGVKIANSWLFWQLHPLVSLGFPPLLDDLVLRTFPFPSFLVMPRYKKLYAYFSSAATEALSMAEKLGLSREEACHNLLFASIFNAWAGFKALFPGILRYLALAGRDVHARLAGEVRAAVGAAGGELTLAALDQMELVRSVVYEALRMDPPVKHQFAVAKKDLVIESHDGSFEVKAGEMLFGYQPFAAKDEKIFGPDAGMFVADRFTGKRGSELLKYLVWSNGPQTESPTPLNKQCAGKNVVVLVARLLVAEFFLRYDTFAAEIAAPPPALKVTVTSLTKTETR